MMPPVTAQETAQESAAPSREQVLQQLDRLVSSRHLRESHQLHAFLGFVVHETLEGRSDGLKEYLLGSQVFRRRADYDPRRDGIVRVQANALRKRLERYYTEDGSQDPIIIEIPRGAYVPTFRFREADAPALRPIVDEPTSPATVSLLKACAIAFSVGVLVTAFLFAAWRWSSPMAPTPFMVTQVQASDCPPLWAHFLKPGSSNLVAYGVPLFFAGGGLYMRDVMVNAPGEGNQSRVHKFGETFNIALQPMDDLYTGVGEAESTYRLSNFFATRGIAVRVANARAIGTSDLSGHNLVAVSSLRFQTLLRDLKLPQEFEFHPTAPETIANLHPRKGEQADYVFQNGAGISTSYALVSLWPGAGRNEKIMHVGGVHTWSTQAAVEFLLQPEQLRKMAREFERDRTTGDRGPVTPYFQILLRVEGRGNQSHRVEYVTHHYLPGTR